ncbi:MAG: prepilin peptidase [Patescibacteria group bacterium]
MTIYYLFIFAFGAIVGSFLNVVILRYNTNEPILKGKSRCFSCNKNLKWYELIPIVSFIIQGGKCRECKSKISWQYPIVEILSGIVFLSVFSINYQILNNLSLYFILSTLYYLAIFSLLIVIAVYDLRHQIIPDFFVYSFDVLAFFAPLVTSYKLQVTSFLAGILFFSFFGLLWLASRGRWMGFGDAKLVLGMGWLLGFYKGLWALLFAFWIGAIVGIFLVLFSKKRYNLNSAIPFGPFLVLGTLISFLVKISV